RQPITDWLGGWVEADEPLHRFLQRRPTSVGGGASRPSKRLLRAPVGPVGADAGDDQGEARDDEGGDVHELIISSARPNARCTAHCRRPAKFADHGGSARASVRPTEPSSATCEATPATNMNPEKLWPRESGPEGPNSHRGVRLRSYQCRLLGQSSATSGSAGTPRPSPGPPRPARAHARPRGSGPQAPFPDWLSAKANPTGQAGRLGPHALAAL